jgi:hypothetical protein
MTRDSQSSTVHTARAIVIEAARALPCPPAGNFRQAEHVRNKEYTLTL